MKSRRAPAWALAVMALAAAIAAAGIAGAATARENRQKLKNYQRNIQENRRDLEDVRQRLQEEKRMVKTVARKERSLLAEIQVIDRRLEEAEDRYQEYQRNLAVVREQIQAIRGVIAETEADLGQLRRFLAGRLRLLYREGQGGMWRILAASRNFSEALSRLKFFHILASQNTFLIEKVTRRRIDLTRQHEKLAMREKQFRQLEFQAQQTLARIQQQRQAREQFLVKIRDERSSHEQAVKELTAASENLNRLIKRLERNAKKIQKNLELAGRQFGQRPRTFPWPTRGRVISRFGRVRHPRFNTYMVNKGIDIAGPIGQNVISVARGQVLFAEWFEGFGRMVILDHGGGFNTVYAHLQNIDVSAGDVVEERQPIGRLGDSGTWKGPSLYFEIRRRGEALDPLKWLEP